MRNFEKVYWVSASLLLIILCISCKKNNIKESNIGYKNVKVFEDTLADIRNTSIHIAAGSEMIYMTYGVYNSNNLVPFNGLDFVTNNIYYANLLATDHAGNLIWKQKLPTGRVVSDILVLDDGTLITASNRTFDRWNQQTISYIYLVHFDKNGHIILEDSVSFANTDINGFKSVHLSRSINNNLIISGSFGYNGDPRISVPFISEIDLNFNLIWERTTFEPPFVNYERSASFSKGLQTPDGNYLFIRDFPNASIADSALRVVKTNSTGDIIWSKPFNPGSMIENCNDFIQNTNGNYQFSFTTGNSLGYTSRVYEVNANGDSVNSVILSKDDIKMNYAIVPKDNGGVFAIMNNYSDEERTAGSNPNSNYPVIDIMNATYVNVDSRLQIASAGLLQTETSDFFRSSCKLPSGQIACCGVIKSAGKSYYKPALIILK